MIVSVSKVGTEVKLKLTIQHPEEQEIHNVITREGCRGHEIPGESMTVTLKKFDEQNQAVRQQPQPTQRRRAA